MGVQSQCQGGGGGVAPIGGRFGGGKLLNHFRAMEIQSSLLVAIQKVFLRIDSK
jgi:hypothetical protein